MDASFRPRKNPSTDRLLALFSAPAPTPASPSAADGELDEGEVFWTGTDFASPSVHDGTAPPSSSSSSPPPSPSPVSSPAPPRGFPSPSLASASSFRRASFGILAALPEDTDASSSSSNARPQNTPRAVTRSPSLLLSQRVVPGAAAAVTATGSISSSPSTASPSPSSTSSSSAARAIPSIPRPRQDYASFSMPVRQQSAPVNVPLPQGRPRARTGFGEEETPPPARGDEDEEEMMPPHEIVAKASAKESPMTTFSVLEGAGRTLKGRDLRRVRNAVWRQTGFLD